MNGPTVAVLNGKLRGATGKNINGGLFYSFKGIPYAKPPLGQLRFKAPQPPESWTGVRDATEEGQDCFSKHPVFHDWIGGEDCLFLNVYTAELPKKDTKLKPVMVWIHGGGFTSGSGRSDIYGPQFLLTQDIVLVTINYRTALLGFLSLEDPELGVPGNAGLKDMVMALQWVQKNIANFCGDPFNVTVFGESAGGAAIHYLILSPKTKGLFHKAILQSGCALNLWASGRRVAIDLAKVLNLNTTDERQILEVIQNLPLQELYEAGSKIKDLFLVCQQRPYGPVIETPSKDAFISDNPINIIKSGNYNKVPMMITYTNREGILSEIMQQPKLFQPITNFELAIPYTLQLARDSDKAKLVAKKIKEFYYKNEEPTVKNKDIFYILEGDNHFIRELIQAIKLHKKAVPNVPIYLARLSVETELNMIKKFFSINEAGTAHGDELGYLFHNMLAPEIKSGSKEDIAIKRFVKLWTNFARNGDPNPKTFDPMLLTEWQPVRKDSLSFIDIGNNITSGINPEADRLAFWDEIFQIKPASKL